MRDPCNFSDAAHDSQHVDFKIFENCSSAHFTYNFSDSRFPRREKTVELVFRILFYSLASFGNCLLLFVMYKDPLKRFRNATSYFIMNISLADLMSILSGVSEAIIQLYPQDPKAGDIQKNQKLALCIYGIGIQSSLLMTMLFSLDRYLAIVHAFTYTNIIGNKYAVKIAIFLPWCFSIIVLPVMYYASLAENVNEVLTRMLAGNFIALSCVTLIVHPYTHWIFVKRLKDLRNSSLSHKELLEEDLKVAKILSSTVLVVSTCLIIFIAPYFVAFCFHVASCDKCFLNNSFLSFWKYYPLLSSVRFMVNSVVYAWRLPLYRKSLTTLLNICAVGTRSLPEVRLHNSRLRTKVMNCSNGDLQTSTKFSENGTYSVSREDCRTDRTVEMAQTSHFTLKPMAFSNNSCDE